MFIYNHLCPTSQDFQKAIISNGVRFILYVIYNAAISPSPLKDISI